METLTCHMKEYIQPFERYLALQELRALAKGPVIPLDGDDTTALTFSIASTNNIEALRTSLAYWHSVGDEPHSLTRQLRSEATHEVARAHAEILQQPGRVSALVPSHLPNRRSLRYATHGLHEYRGKFFPQMVRALINIAQLPDDGVVLDPMSGSGTTLVEARLSGRSSYGLDMNPLAVFITDAKCQALTLEPTALKQALDQIKESIREPIKPRTGPELTDPLAKSDRAYLERWFCEQTIMELDHIQAAINRMPTVTLTNFFLAVLSNILREVSRQKTDDLRSRREQNELRNEETITLFLKEATRSTQTVAAFLAEHGSAALGDYSILEGDARRSTNVFPELVSKVDAVITSPPYATALPYIDTDRLSLIYLGLLPRLNHKNRDKLMIGNREVSPREREAYWTFYGENRYLLPEATQELIERVYRLNAASSVGFRRKNLSALLSKYFFDMCVAMQQTFDLIRPGGRMFMVIGNNQTTAGTQDVAINTPDHLANIAGNLGFQRLGTLPMEMLVSRDIFRYNAVPSEQILSFQKPQ